MSELTPEELALLEQAGESPMEEPKRRGRTRRVAEPVAVQSSVERGPHTPPQFADDGWAQVPVQMRG